MRRDFRKSNVSRVGGFLKSTLQSLGVQEKLLEQKALAKWAQTVGPQIAASTRADAVREGVLFVCCKSSMWSSELTLHKDDIVKKLNAAVGKQVVKDIRFTARGFRKVEEVLEEPVEGRIARLDKIAVPEEDARSAEEAAAMCESDVLAARIREAILTSKRLKEVKLQEGYKPCVRCSELHNGKYDICDSCRTAR